MERVITYIDGFNLYYGLRSKGWKWAYWLNLQILASLFLRQNQQLITLKYFTSIINHPQDRHDRQAEYLNALSTLTNLEIFYGHYLSNTITCHYCHKTHDTFHEKMTDVNIAVELMTDSFLDKFDVALLLTADSDLIGPIKAVHKLFPRKKIITLFPPARYSNALKSVTYGYLSIGRDKLLKALFPNDIIQLNGHVLHKPAEWV